MQETEVIRIISNWLTEWKLSFIYSSSLITLYRFNFWWRREVSWREVSKASISESSSVTFVIKKNSLFLFICYDYIFIGWFLEVVLLLYANHCAKYYGWNVFWFFLSNVGEVGKLRCSDGVDKGVKRVLSKCILFSCMNLGLQYEWHVFKFPVYKAGKIHI